MFTLYNSNYLCVVDYHKKFPVFKQIEDLSADNLILACKITISEYGLPKEIMSDTDGNFISYEFKRFCGNVNIEQAVTSSFYHQSNGQVEVCIKFIKNTIKNAFMLNQICIQLCCK